MSTASLKRKLAAILYADVAGYSRLTSEDEEGTHRALSAYLDAITTTIERHGGKVLHYAGDAVLADFTTVSESLACAAEIQRDLKHRNKDLPGNRKLQFRIGVNLGEVIVDRNEIYGDGVNIAARLQALAKPGGILVSGTVYEQVRDRMDITFVYAGQRRVKNIEHPVHAYEVETGSSKRSRTIIAELQRRKVFGTAIGYLVLAWLIVPIAALVLPAMEAPRWALPTAITILVLGFPPTMMLAWLFDITPRGLRRITTATTRDKSVQSAWVGLTLVLPTVTFAAFATWWIWASYLEDAQYWVAAEEKRKQTPMITVTPVQNMTGNPELHWLSEGIATLIRDRLAQSRHLVMVSRPRWESMTRSFGANANVFDVASRAEIDFVVSGEIIASPSGLILTHRVTDVGRGTEVAAQAFENLTEEDLFGTVERIAILTKQGLKIPHSEQVDSFAADFAISNFAAYHAYISGLEYFLRFDYKNSEQALNTALQLAPDFHIARYRLAFLQWVTGRRRAAAENLSIIPPEAQLTRRERLYIDGAAAFLKDRDLARAIALFKALLVEFPYEIEARLFLAEVYYHDHQETTAIDELQLLAKQAPDNGLIWSALAIYLTSVGRFDEADIAAQKYREIAPNNPDSYHRLAELRRQMGDYPAAIEYFGNALAQDPNFTLARLGLAQLYVFEGDFASAETLWEEIFDNREAEPRRRITAAFDRAWSLRARGRQQQAIEALQSVAKDIENEEIRAALALELRARCLNDLGRHTDARALFEAAIERAPAAPTGFLFALGVFHLGLGEFEKAEDAADEIRRHALPETDPDRTEDKAAAYLIAMTKLAEGKAADAINELQNAAMLNGYRYTIYEVGLAEALWRDGQLGEARAVSARAKVERDPGDLRLDLEWDRMLARRLEINILRELGEISEADKLRDEYATRYGSAERLNQPLSLAFDPPVGRPAVTIDEL